MMRNLVAALAAGLMLAGTAAAGTLDDVKKRGNLECGVHLGLPGFSYADDKGVWTGIDVDLCRAVAAAIFGDATKVKYTPTSVQQRWARDDECPSRDVMSINAVCFSSLSSDQPSRRVQP